MKAFAFFQRPPSGDSLQAVVEELHHSEVSYRRKKLLRRATILLCAGVLVGGPTLLLSRSPASFPALPAGGYVGELTGVFEPTDRPVTVYLESVAQKNAVLLVAFRPGWEPQLFSLTRLSDSLSSLAASDAVSESATPTRAEIPDPVPEKDCSESNPCRYQPLTLTIGDKSFAVAGTAKNDRASGQVHLAGTNVGTWWLRAVTSAELRADQGSSPGSIDLPSWLPSKAQHRQRTAELQSLVAEVANEAERTKTVRALTDTNSPITLTAIAYRDELAARNEELRAALAAKTTAVDALIAESQQLERITRLGRTIDLARRVSVREDTWYQVNWQQDSTSGGEHAGIEEELARSLDVDLERLNRSYARALEVRNLRGRLTEERARVAELTRRYQEKLAPAQDTKDGGTASEDRPWWQKWN